MHQIRFQIITVQEPTQIDIHCVQKKTPTHIFFHISVNNVRI